MSTSFRISLSNVIGAVLSKFLIISVFFLLMRSPNLAVLSFLAFLHKNYLLRHMSSAKSKSPILSLFPFHDTPLDIVLFNRMTKFIAIENSNGERMQPCVTPVFTLNGSDGSLFTSTVHSEFRYKLDIRLITFSGIPVEVTKYMYFEEKILLCTTINNTISFH